MHAPRTIAPLCGSVCLVAILVGGTGAAEPAAAPRPNILFLVADDLATRLGCYGDRAAITPHINRLASEGVVFTHAYSQGASAHPAAPPSCSGGGSTPTTSSSTPRR